MPPMVTRLPATLLFAAGGVGSPPEVALSVAAASSVPREQRLDSLSISMPLALPHSRSATPACEGRTGRRLLLLLRWLELDLRLLLCSLLLCSLW